MDKQVLFNYWDTIGKENIFLEDYDMSLKMLDMEEYDNDYSLLIEWWGGVAALDDYFSLLKGKKINVGRNGYNFDIVLSHFGYDEDEYMFECYAYTDYEGDMVLDGKKYNIADMIQQDKVMGNDDKLNEIGWEMRDIINEFIEVKIPCGFLLRCIDFEFI